MAKAKFIWGASGAGKTSKIDVQSRRYTTRDIRDEELVTIKNKSISRKKAEDIKAKRGIFRGQNGNFVTPEYFDSLSQNEMIGTIRYPNPETGDIYSFNREEILNALAAGEEIVEQIVDFSTFHNIRKSLPEDSLENILFLAFAEDSEKRIAIRDESTDDIEGRRERLYNDIGTYLDNILEFDRIFMSAPYTRLDVIEGRRKNKLANDIQAGVREYEKALPWIEKVNARLLDKIERDEPLNQKDMEEAALAEKLALDGLKLLFGSLEASNESARYFIEKNPFSQVANIEDIEHPFYTDLEAVTMSTNTRILYPHPKDPILIGKYMIDSEEVVPEYFKQEVSAAIMKMIKTQQSIHYDLSNPNPLADINLDDMTESQIQKMRDQEMFTCTNPIVIPEITHFYLPVIMSAIYEEIGEKEKAIAILEESLHFAEEAIPEAFDVQLVRFPKGKHIEINDLQNLEAVYEKLKSIEHTSVYAQLMKRTVEYVRKPENQANFLSTLMTSEEPDSFIIKNFAAEHFVDGLSLIEDRLNNITNQTTSRWPVKQELIDEAMKLTGGKGHYIPY